MSGLNIPVPAYMEDEEFALFRDSVVRFLDIHAGPQHLDRWRKDGSMPGLERTW